MAGPSSLFGESVTITAMARVFVVLFTAVVATALLVGAYYAWFDGAAWVAATDRPRTLQWATRCLAVAAAAGAQVLLLTFVVRSRGGLRLTASLVCCMAAVSAAALGLAARE